MYTDGEVMAANTSGEIIYMGSRGMAGAGAAWEESCFPLLWVEDGTVLGGGGVRL